MTSNPAIKRYWLIVFIVTSLTCKKVIQPPQPQFEKLEAISSLYQKNPFQAIKLLHSIEDTNLQNEKARLLFKIYIDQRQYRHAINIVESLKIAVARESLAMVYARAGNFASAARFATHPLIKGIFFYRAGDYDSTIEQLKNPVNEYDDYRLHYLARALFKKGYWREVEQTLRTVKTIPPYLEEEHFELLARSLTNSGEPDQAEAIIEQIKDEPLRLYLKIGLLEQRGEKAEALNLAWGLITRFPRSNFALSMLEKVRPRNVAEFVAAAEVYYNINNYRKALNYLNHALKNPKANFLRGMIFYQLNNYDSALHYLTLCKNARSYYWRGRIYETRNQDSLAIIAYDSLLLKFPGDQIHLRALRRKGHLFEEKALFNKACSIWVAIANQFPQERRRHLFRCGLLCYRSGEVDKAREFFRQDSSPEFIYWQIRMNERLGLETESLRIELLKRYPMSYYTMIKERQNRFCDTIPVKVWLKKFTDTVCYFSSLDSALIKRAIFFLSYGEVDIGTSELKLINPGNTAGRLFLARLYSNYGLDHEAIRLAYTVRRDAEQAGIKRISHELLPLLYPVKYVQSIIESGLEPAFLLAVIRQESYFNPRALSPANAMGLMQIIPRTGSLLAKDLQMAEYNLYDPDVSLKFGTKYLKDQVDRFDCLPLALAAYNGGPVNVIRWLNRDPASELDEFIELIPFDETRDYVKNVLLQKEIYTHLINAGDLP